MKRLVTTALFIAPLLALSITLGCPATAATGTGDGDGDADRVADVLGEAGSATNGADLFDADCRICHGAMGEGGSGGPVIDLSDDTDEEIVELLIDGDGNMPSWSDYSDQELADVLAHIKTL